MEFLQLKYFCDAAETENFSKTAKKFMVPTSAVSQSIRRLENELGVELFERRSNRITLNEDGQVFYKAVQRVNKTLTDARRQLSDDPADLTGEVKLQIFCSRRVVSDAISRFNELYPEVTFVLNHGYPSDEIFDLIISDEDLLKERYSRIPLVTENIGVAFSKNHPLARHETVTPKMLTGQRFITLNQHSRLYHMTRKLCSQAGFIPLISVQCDDPFYVRKYIEMGLGIGFVPMFSWKGLLSEALVCRQLEGVTRTTYAYWDDSRYMTKTVKRFLQILIEMCPDRPAL
jgi:DNA-binding transcriptional LysR family regulator